MEKKQSKTPDLEIKKASESLTEQDLKAVSGGASGSWCDKNACPNHCSSD